jgi:KipI family sensor histidine kinase inhibitor
VLPCGDGAFSVDFGDAIDAGLIARVAALDAALSADPPLGVVETVPTYRALLVAFDPARADPPALARRLAELAEGAAAPRAAGRTWRVPVVYGGTFGEDLALIAAHAGLSPEDYARRHAAGDYAVAMIGFMPGFCYLAGLDPALAMPRRETPRPRIPAGSVSVGGIQTAVGSVESPSGWRLIGRTPARAFMPGREPPFLFAPGDRIRFEAVPAVRWAELDAAAAAGEPVAERAP